MTKVLESFAALPGFEPGNDGIRIRCLTTWRQRYFVLLLYRFKRLVYNT